MQDEKSIDKRWFREKLSRRDLSQRRLAKLLNIDPAAISHVLNGRRKMTMAEAAQLAALLDVTPSEVFERLGIETHSPNRVKIIGTINGKSEIAFHPEGTHSLIAPPGDVPAMTIAVQVRTAGTALERADGQIYFIDHIKTTPANNINNWCACAIKGGKALIAQIKKGYANGTYNLILMDGSILESQELAWASPVTWAKFPT